jgi:hypothetical protein
VRKTRPLLGTSFENFVPDDWALVEMALPGLKAMCTATLELEKDVGQEGGHGAGIYLAEMSYVLQRGQEAFRQAAVAALKQNNKTRCDPFITAADALRDVLIGRTQHLRGGSPADLGGLPGSPVGDCSSCSRRPLTPGPVADRNAAGLLPLTSKLTRWPGIIRRRQLGTTIGATNAGNDPAVDRCRIPTAIAGTPPALASRRPTLERRTLGGNLRHHCSDPRTLSASSIFSLYAHAQLHLSTSSSGSTKPSYSTGRRLRQTWRTLGRTLPS